MKSVSRRVGRALVVAAAAALAVAGCGGNNGGGSGGSTSGGKTNLTWFMWTGSATEVQSWKHLADMVTQKYPDITITFQTASFNDYFTKLAAQASGGNAPCLLGMQSLRAPGLGQLLRPLDDVAKKNGVDLSQFDQSIVKGLQVNGQQVAIPYDLGPLLIYYNKDMLTKAGVSMPKPGWSTDDFLSDAKKLTSVGKYGFAAFPLIDWTLPFATSIFGVNPVSPDGKVDLTNPQFVKAMQWYVDLVQKQKVAPPIPSSNDGSWPINQFLSGNTAMVVDGPWDLINTKAQAKFQVGLVPVPAGPNGSRTVTAGSGFGIARNCKYPDQTMKAISVITGPEAQQYLAEQGRAFPALTAQEQYWYKNAVPGAQQALEKANQGSEPYRTTSSWNQLSQLFTQYGVQAMNGQQPVRTWLQNVQQQAGSS
jgi:multiple sugar transport system substrate-binding protein